MVQLRGSRRIAAVFLAVGGALGAWLSGCGSPAAPPPSGLLLITLDTARADRIGAYGYADIETPFIDGLARAGVVFERALSPVPLTLPSHASLMTGTYPPRHGVRDNGDFKVPQELTTLAELFRARGFRTGAFVGAFVLDRRWGLDQGFEHYSGEFQIQGIADLVSIGDLQRPANEVVDDALAWLNGVAPDEPFFAWVHLFDPHDPYDPPSPYRERYSGRPYVGEIAYSDAELARLGAWLSTSGRSDTTMVVFAGDHGESLGEHGESGHGFFLYQETLRVPLIVVDPLRGGAGTRRREVVSLIDVFPTLCERFGLEAPAAIQGRSLAPLLGGGGRWEERPVYSETFYPFLSYGWSPLSSIQDRRYHYVESSEVELYDMESDPGELRDLATSEPAVLESLGEVHDALIAQLARDAGTEAALPDPDTVAKLAALGYTAGGAGLALPASRTGLASPRQRIDVYNRLVEARLALTAGNLELAETLLGEALAGDAGVAETYSLIGRVRLARGEYDEAVAVFEQGLGLKPNSFALSMGLATAMLRAGRTDDSLEVVARAAEQRPDEAWPMLVLGSFARQAGRLDAAERALQRALELDPGSAGANLELAVVALAQGSFDRAGELASRALELDPRLRGAHLCRAQSLEAVGQMEAALAEYELERKLSPDDHRPAYGLARLYGRLGRPGEERQLLEETIRLEPGFVPAYLFLARSRLAAGEGYPEAIALVQRALTYDPTGADLVLAYYLLADLYNRVGDRGLSNEFGMKGRQAEQELAGARRPGT
jgi:arylsulfatase A-like enzyme/Tfp pilus assembly protein PilF